MPTRHYLAMLGFLKRILNLCVRMIDWPEILLGKPGRLRLFREIMLNNLDEVCIFGSTQLLSNELVQLIPVDLLKKTKITILEAHLKLSEFDYWIQFIGLVCSFANISLSSNKWTSFDLSLVERFFFMNLKCFRNRNDRVDKRNQSIFSVNSQKLEVLKVNFVISMGECLVDFMTKTNETAGYSIAVSMDYEYELPDDEEDVTLKKCVR